MTEHDQDGGTGTISIEREEISIKQPSMYQVILYNDDYTPFNFVMDVLVKFFQMDSQKAFNVMMVAHTTGKVICGVYPKDIAETKANQATEYSKVREHPLQFSVEEV
jgi:ATP-dependent Clp protease adaptor protein ClpS